MDNSALLAILGAQPNRKFLASLTTGSAELMQQATIFPEIFNFRDSSIFSFYETCLSGTAKIVRNRFPLFPSLFFLPDNNFRSPPLLIYFSSSFSSLLLQDTNYILKPLQEDGHLTMNGDPTVLVDRDSATHSRPWEMSTKFIIPINRNHSDLVKFERLSDGYEKVLDRIREVAEISARAVRSRFEMQV